MMVFTQRLTFWLLTNLHINHCINLHSTQATFHSKQFATSLNCDNLLEIQSCENFSQFLLILMVSSALYAFKYALKFVLRNICSK